MKNNTEITVGTQFTMYSDFLDESVRYEVIKNARERLPMGLGDEIDDVFVCEMIDYSGPHERFTSAQILAQLK